MVIFHKETLEKELTAEEIEKQRLRAIENSDAWRDHAKLHAQSGWDAAQLHIPGEAILGEREDPVRARFGLAQKPRESTKEVATAASVSYGAQHISQQHNITYTAAGNKSDLWASCNCGAEFKAEQKGGELKVTSYGVPGTDAKATSYAVSSASSSSSYEKGTASSGYTTATQSTASYN